METFRFIQVGREGFSSLSEKEWLVTNSIGGYASGTVSGVLSRRYHGLLMAALKPPLGRTLLGVKTEEEVSYNDEKFSLSSNLWKDNFISPEGFNYIESFSLEGLIPTWNYVIHDALVVKRIWMEPNANTTYVSFEVVRATSAIKLEVKTLGNCRDYHAVTKAPNLSLSVEKVDNGIQAKATDGVACYFILSKDFASRVVNEWYYGYFLQQEFQRGLDCIEDHLHLGTFVTTLKQGQSAVLVYSTDEKADLDGINALERKKTSSMLTDDFLKYPQWIQQLRLVADSFLVSRQGFLGTTGKTIIAGYHWFGDWGRDTMISLPGLTLTTGKFSIAKSILQTFGKYVNQGMLPNRFPDSGSIPEYNTADATLWYFESIRAYFEKTNDVGFIEEIFSVLEGIVDWHFKGTRYNIHVDPLDGLLYVGDGLVQLTWMDAKIGDWVVTPRTGKPVEINALWYNALKTMEFFSLLLKKDGNRYLSASKKVFDSFQRFWNVEHGFCYDVIDGPNGNDLSLRPNQIFTVSLLHSPFTEEKQKAIIEVCGRNLLTSHGLRSLSSKDPSYKGVYQGSAFDRDSRYHQGTVWGWLIGPYAIAHYKIFKDRKLALSFLEPMALHLHQACLGTCSEIFDGDDPFIPRGCVSQAWTVAEVLRAWVEIS